MGKHILTSAHPEKYLLPNFIVRGLIPPQAGRLPPLKLRDLRLDLEQKPLFSDGRQLTQQS